MDKGGGPQILEIISLISAIPYSYVKITSNAISIFFIALMSLESNTYTLISVICILSADSAGVDPHKQMQCEDTLQCQHIVFVGCHCRSLGISYS